MRRALAALIAGALAGCHATTSLEPPVPPEGTRSMLLFVKGEELEIGFAIDVAEDGTASFPTFTRPEEIDLYSAHFACPLDVLGLEAGRLSFAADPSERLELPPPERVLASHDAAEQSAWEPAELEAVDPLLRSLALPEENLCRLYGVRLGPLDVTFTVGTSTPTALIALQNGNALVANADHTFFEVDADRNARRVDALAGAPNRAGFQADDGTLWLVGIDGTIARGELDEGFEIIQTAGATVAELSLVDGARSGEPDLYRASYGGPFERFSGGRWEKLTSGGGDFDFGSYSVAWIGPKDAIATGALANSTSAVRFTDGELEEVEMPESERPSSVLHIPGLGLIIGTVRGRIIRERDEVLEVDQESDIPGQVRSIVRTEHGFFYGRTTWASWDPIAGYCKNDLNSPDGPRLVPLGDRGFLAISDLILDSFLFTLDREEIDHPCLGK